ncbi:MULTISPECIES: DUF3243 domain-containing protein [Virgibacillus]|uniref:DUF3243 family protein n=2 Tax=Virgibacillus TaxID=84406 RepID=A0A024QCY9_9BACI|nr:MULTISPECIES: DUF3243 domain-containing protein [Virgibacillus]EQB36354.1 hypothetical protein M948_15085 [Virgibacillus sp. CM-4]MYL42185.1 DUF3243 family protein [Virgibacillus massiliensis]GGJ44621.1 hypothetical protein GCM10007111_03330 [Virgibacillus kapii]CDQ40050.1 hypothetical protein BN990_02368 [Virgibacillus massiliensis]
MSVLDNFDSWKSFLSSKLTQAQQQGMSDKTIQNVAQEVGDYLAQNVDAKNNEEAVLRDLWNAASEDEQQAIANTMVKFVQNQGNQQ